VPVIIQSGSLLVCELTRLHWEDTEALCYQGSTAANLASACAGVRRAKWPRTLWIRGLKVYVLKCTERLLDTIMMSRSIFLAPLTNC
jgi:hypothetical protein